MTKPNALTHVSDDDMYRFHFSYEELPNACWQWSGPITTVGYGRMQLQKRQHSAHRVSYFLRHGAIDQNLVIDHLCRNRACVNPDHLEMVTQKTNVRRGDRCARTRSGLCTEGHAVTGENAMKQRQGDSMYYICRQCNRDYMREYMRERSRKARAALAA